MFTSVTLLFIRHGRQQPDANGQIGRLSPLSELGRRQADLVAAELAVGPPLGAVYSSPLPRAVATAEVICVMDPKIWTRNWLFLDGGRH